MLVHQLCAKNYLYIRVVNEYSSTQVLLGSTEHRIPKGYSTNQFPVRTPFLYKINFPVNAHLTIK